MAQERSERQQKIDRIKLLEALAAWAPHSASAQKVRKEQLRYFRNQRQRMNYPEYLRQGFPIGSGAAS